jgi:transcription-repair coupling factor (superfamily II helicase)
MRFAQLHSKVCKIKEYKNRLILTLSGVASISKAQIKLNEMVNS